MKSIVIQLVIAVCLVLLFERAESAPIPEPQSQTPEQSVSKNSRNIFSLNAPQFHNLGGLYGFSGGFGYERYLNESGTLSVEIPYLYHHGTNGNSGSLKGNAYYKTCYGHYLAPAFYYHPLGNQHKNDIAIGLSVLAGNVQVTEHHNMNGSEVAQTNDQFILSGISGQFAWHRYFSKHLLFGSEIGFGKLIGPTPDDNPKLFHIGLKFGWRF